MAVKDQCINSERTELGEVLPLETPYTLNIYVTTLCDFKCSYCFQTLGREKIIERFGPTGNMTFQTFQKVIDSLDSFSSKLKTIIFTGHGEPLLNPMLADMIAYASKKDVSERIELITNANRLTHSNSDALIDAGLTSLRVSVQGVSAKKYREISDVDIDFDAFVEQLHYFYQRKRGLNCTVYCKTVDAALDPGDEDKFLNIFRTCCDFIHVEKVVKFDRDVAYRGLKNIDKNINKNGTTVTDIHVCPIPFYTLDVYADGTITNCHIRKASEIGNIASMGIYEAWNSYFVRRFWNRLLDSGEPECFKCHFKQGLVKQGDCIDHYIGDIRKKLRV